MPIYTKNRVVKVTCRECGWSLVINRGGFGDCVNGTDSFNIAMCRLGECCPSCKSRSLDEQSASRLAYFNPVGWLRRFYWVLR
jgi:hypothetical protein